MSESSIEFSDIFSYLFRFIRRFTFTSAYQWSKIEWLLFQSKAHITNVRQRGKQPVAFSITTFSPPCSLNKVPASGNTVQPTLPCWVVPTAGSLCISSRSFVLASCSNFNR